MLHSRKRILCLSNGSSGLPLSALQQGGHECRVVGLASDGLKALAGESPDIVLFDMRAESAVCLGMINELKELGGRLPFLVVSPANSVALAVAAMKAGATDILEAPLTAEALTRAINDIISGSACSHSTTQTPRFQRASPPADFGAMAGSARGMRELFSKIEQIAERDTTVLITGESGTGKELVAREIHQRSLRRNGPFVALNCAAIPETLIESELFGHEKGAFTHAVERRLGQVELANGGTLFLDEIGELSLAVQVKLLRFLQEQEFYRVGKSKPISVDIRVITATNRDLEESVRQKSFRQDLLYRINVINLHIPALRDRAEDIPRLVEHCAAKLSPRYGGKKLSFTPEALACLSAYPWPGNVRELENILEGVLALSPSSEIEETDLPSKVRDHRSGLEGFAASTLHTSGIAFGEAERIFETEMIIRALEKADYVQTRAAQLLGITRRILKYKMDKLGISDKGEVGSEVGPKNTRAN